MGAVLLLSSMLLVLSAVALLARARRSEFENRVESRFQGLVARPRPPASARGWYQRSLQRVGLAPKPRYGAFALGGLLLTALVVAVLAGPAAALVAALCYASLLYGLLQVLYRRRVERIVAQLPLFVDHVIRALQTGASLEAAINAAAAQAKVPLKQVTDRVQRAVQVGDSLGDALEDTARLYDIRYLYVLTLGARVNARYGSSAITLFKSLQQMIHQRERAGRELRALTGETRLSAAVLAALPAALAGYILWTNPAYLSGMWADPSGRSMMLLALAWQGLGIGVIWRLIRSI